MNSISVEFVVYRDGISHGDSIACHRFKFDAMNQRLTLWDASGQEDIFWHVIHLIVRML